MRFYVYSDTPLASVTATVLGGDAGVSKTIPVAKRVPAGDPLFFIAVELWPDSMLQEQAVVSFEGHSADGQMVLKKTVSAAFAHKQTSFVRVLLSSACTEATIDKCGCDASTGSCMPEELTPRKFDPSIDLRDRCMNCGKTYLVPRSEDIISASGTIDLQTTYMRRVLAAHATSLAAVGINTLQRARFRFFVARDDGQRPGPILAVSGELVADPSTLSTDVWRNGTEWKVPITLPAGGSAYYVGVQALSGTPKVSVAELVMPPNAWASPLGSIPEVGQTFVQLELSQPSFPQPYIYAVFND